MLWPLLVLGHVVVLVTSRPSPQEELSPWRPPPTSMALRPHRSMQWLPPAPPPARPDPEGLAPADDELLSPGAKRALSVLSRWKPFSGGLRQLVSRFSARAPPLPPPAGVGVGPASPELDFVSAETRGIMRPLGQPLRWGRR
ncbi:hypothetical protein R5R35_004753 [Gryllus longicercus]|uniref:Uncharacterized protein n=1 Tax=Gryllus longicercus TaxID=2509291 RepID=A0AAN9W5Q6_9ORTH